MVDFGGRVASACTPVYQELKAHLGFGSSLRDETITMLNTVGVIDERVLTRFHVPFRRVYLKPASGFHLQIAPDGSFHDEWGVKYVPRNFYNERVGHPLAHATLNDLDRFPWPDPFDPGRVAGLRQQAERLRSETGCALSAGHVSAGVFQDCWNLRGMARFLEDMLTDREFAEGLLDRVLAVHVGMWSVFLDAVGTWSTWLRLPTTWAASRVS